MGACVNIAAPVESMYHWRPKIDTESKRCRNRVEAVSKLHKTNFRKSSLSLLHMDPPHSLTAPAPKPWRDVSARRCRLAALAAVFVAVGAGVACAAGGDLLPAEQAFRFSARALDERTLEARFTIADGYYLYRDKLKFVVSPGGATLGAAELPAGKVKTDEFFGKVETYRGTLVVKLALSGAMAGQTVLLAADSQGCADIGVCYPPTQQKVNLPLPMLGRPPGALVDATPPKKNWFQ